MKLLSVLIAVAFAASGCDTDDANSAAPIAGPSWTMTDSVTVASTYTSEVNGVTVVIKTDK